AFYRAVVAFAALLSVFGHAGAEEPAPKFVVHTAHGDIIRQPLSEIKNDWSLVVGKNARRLIPGKDLLSLRRSDVPLPPFPPGPQLFLHGGDRLPVRATKVDGERVLFQHPDLNGGKETSLPLSGLSLFWRAAPANVDNPEAFARKLARQTRTRDQVLLRNGD